MIARRALLAALGAVALPRAVRAQTMPVFRIGMALTDGVTPVLYGIRTGAFKAANVDVQLVAGNSGAALAAAIAGGALDVAASSLMPLITGHARGVELRIIAGSSIYSADAPTSELCVLKTSPIKTFADFAGKTVAVLAGHSLDTLGIMALVDKSGAASSSLQLPRIAELADARARSKAAGPTPPRSRSRTSRWRSTAGRCARWATPMPASSPAA